MGYFERLLSTDIKVISFQMKKSTSGNLARPWPCIRYKSRDDLVSDTRPWTYNRGNTVVILTLMKVLRCGI